MNNNIAIFASGNGSNAQALIDYFDLYPNKGQIKLVLSNKSDAFVLERAKKAGIKAISFTAKEFTQNPDTILDILQQYKIDLIVLAGYMQLIPHDMIEKFRDRIVNIHPALLPKYGGKGMYGMNVHKAVIENKEQESGITIHYVSEHYDSGAIIFQSTIKVEPCDSAESLAQKVLELEHRHYSEVITEILKKLN